MALIDWARARLDAAWAEREELGAEVLIARGVGGADASALVRAAGEGIAALIVTPRAWEYLEPAKAPTRTSTLAPAAPESIAQVRDALVGLEREVGRPLGEVVTRIDANDLEELLAGEVTVDDLMLDENEAGGEEELRPAPGMLVQIAERPIQTVAAAWTELTPSGLVDVVVGAGTPAELLVRIGFGGFNECPNPPEQMAFWVHAAERWGASPIVVDGDRLEAIATRPPRAIEEVALLTAEHLAYDADLSQDLMPLAIACRLWGSTVWRFWWD